MSITLEQYNPSGELQVFRVPASKSLLNRALILAAFSEKRVKLLCGDLSEDTRAMLACLRALGIACDALPEGIEINGCTLPPRQNAELNVHNAGTAARFLTVALAFCGGDYCMRSSPQMAKRPMDILNLLERSGVCFEWLGERGAFPFIMHSEGMQNTRDFTVNTDVSTQYASGLLLAAPLRRTPLVLHLTGGRTHGTYIDMTLQLLSDFGAKYERTGDTITVLPALSPPAQYTVEADISGACYFYALALLFSTRVLVKDVRLDSMQSDVQFLRLLETKGVIFTQQPDGLLADATNVRSFTGFEAVMKDFSDQTLTAAALAPFAASPSRLRGIGHIRKQECDRVNAIVENLGALGVPVRTNGDDLEIFPAPVQRGIIKTFGDHRVAMSFALTALKSGSVTIDDPACCAKTFENYFELIGRLH